jgi:hypothetical protein
MTLLPFRAGRRALPLVSAFALTPAFLVGTIALGAHPALALRQDAKTDEKKDEKTYTLVRTFKAKDVNHYKLNLNTSINSPQLGGNIDIVMTMLMKETTKEVKDNGSAVLMSEFDSANVKFGDNEQDMTALMPSVTSTVDKTGRILDTKIEGGNPMFTQGPGANMFKNISPQTYFPPKAVKVGDTWKIDSSADAPDKDDKSKDKEKNKAVQKTTGTATLVGVETINGLQTLKIKMATDSESTLENPMNPGEKLDIKAHTEGVSNVDMASGKLVKLTSTSTSEGGPQGKMKVDLMFALVTDDKAKKDDKATAAPDKPKN